MPSAVEDEIATEDDSCSPEPSSRDFDHNLRVESAFSAFNGVFMGMIFFGAPVIAYACLNATVLELTIMTAAFPCGAFLGPLWARMGRRLGMKQLVLLMALVSNLPLLVMPWVNDAATFTVIVTMAQLMHSGMRMGMSSTYRATYPRDVLGRAIGQLTFCQFSTMIPSVLLAGWISDQYPESYKLLFPLAALSGLVACTFYKRLRIANAAAPAAATKSLRGGLADARAVLVHDRAFLLLQVGFFLCGGAFFMSNHVTLMLSHDELGFTAGDLALWLSVLPQIALAATSLVWGRVLDRIGIVRARLGIAILMTFYLSCYFLGIYWRLPWLICVGSLLRGASEGGGQVTWAIASVQSAPRAEDVPLYNGIHFVLNGIRGLVMPGIGSLLAIAVGQWTVFLAALVAGVSVYVGSQALRGAARADATDDVNDPTERESCVSVGG
jgi:MFS family permease